MTLQDAQAGYFSFMGNSCCAEPPPELSAIQNNIDECSAMLLYAIDRADKNEISFWRRMLQAAKVQRRELLAA